jgi:hypothetical protein
VECPDDNDLYWIAGEYRIPCSAPADLTFHVYKDDDNYDDPDKIVGTCTAHFDGINLQDVNCDAVAKIFSAHVQNGDLVVVVEAFGWEGDTIGEMDFKSNTGFELIVEGCGHFQFDQHTSCSQDILLNIPMPAIGGGTLTWLAYCGCNDYTVPTEEQSWGWIKALYR